jgi:hypothetical protein
MIRALLAAAVGVAAGFPNPNPHAVRDAQDAIATARADWQAQYPLTNGNGATWERAFSATLSGKVWTIRQRAVTAHPPTTIRLDATDGHIISASNLP